MKKKLSILILLTLLLGLIFGSVSAQTYYFSVPFATVELFANEDGTASIRYTYTFQNSTTADSIEYVDIGLPNRSFNLGSVTASIDGKAITSISTADAQYVPGGNGITLSLGSLSIPPGGSGTVEMVVHGISGLFYEADEPENYASFQFMPNYFGKEYVYGETSYVVILHLPVGMNAEQPVYFTPKNWPGSADPDESGFDADGRVYYKWTTASGNIASEYYFGAAFPMELVPETAIQAKPSALQVFFASIGNLIENIFPICCAGLFIAGPIGVGILSAKQQNKRKLKYLPPKVRIEGHGIKRGLTAVQAAILLERPMDQIITMILFSVIRKGAAEVVQKEPLKIKTLEPQPQGLYPYEVQFLEAMANSSKKDQTRDLQQMMIALVNSVKTKMKGFSYKETTTYYQDIVTRAWAQVETADTPDMKMENYDKYMPWAMLDDQYETKTRDIFTTMPRPVFVPMWWGRYDPTFRPATTSSRPSGGAGGGAFGKQAGTPSMPTLPGADFAAGLVLGAQNFASNTIGDLTSFTERITNKTNPMPKPSTTSRSGGFKGGGGSSCACACACAGCACACAGGGR
ncbi:MAG: hypothetical protein JW750_12710 [Anaerolineaceae bacterium]|nr:hypothetical protein [Anaerolineaceae bacterium]